MKAVMLCKSCRNPLPFDRRHKKNVKYCNSICAADVAYAQYRFQNPKPKGSLSSGTVGAIGEYNAVCDLLTRGYNVFRNTATTAPDLMVCKQSQLLRVEVTIGHYSTTGRLTYSPHNPLTFDVLAVVCTKGIVYIPDSVITESTE